MSAPEQAQGKAVAMRLGVGIVLAAVIVLVLHAGRYWPFISDDALISLRYAERWLDGQGLTWNDGERVEGYSNLLWVIGASALGLFGVPLVAATRVLGVLGMGAAIAAIVWLHRPRRAGDTLPAAAGALAMALTGSFAVWTIGGLEQPLFVALVAWALVLLVAPTTALARDPVAPAPARQWLMPGLLLALATWTRPDAPLFTATAAATVLLVGRARGAAWRGAILVGLLPVAFVLLQTGFRWLYYGDWLPNPAHQKLAFTPERLAGGIAYVRGGLLPLGPLAVAGLLGLLVAAIRPETRVRAWLFGLPLLVWLGWVIAIGGDIFPGRRHLVVPVLLLALFAAELARAALGGAASRGRVLAATGVSIVLLAGLGILQWRGDRAHLRAIREVPWALRGEALGRLLGRAFEAEQPLLATTAAGALPFFSRLPALDMLGLNDRYLAMNPPPSLGRGRIAHELGDGAYFMRRDPDLVAFCGTSGAEKACSRGGREMQADPRFASRYELVTFHAVEPVSMLGRVWVRTESPRIGIRRDARAIAVPGLFFSGAAARLDAEGRIGVPVEPGHGIRREDVALGSGSWVVDAESSGAPLRARIDRAAPGDEALTAEGPLPLAIRTDAPARVRLTLQASGEAHVRAVSLVRTD